MAQDDDDDGPPGESKDTAKAPGAIQIAFDELKNGDLAGPGAEKAPAGVLLADTDDGEPDDGELMSDDEIEALPLFQP